MNCTFSSTLQSIIPLWVFPLHESVAFRKIDKSFTCARLEKIGVNASSHCAHIEFIKKRIWGRVKCAHDAERKTETKWNLFAFHSKIVRFSRLVPTSETFNWMICFCFLIHVASHLRAHVTWYSNFLCVHFT